MTSKTIADLTDGGVPDSFDRIPVERRPYGSDTNRRITPRDLIGLKIAVMGDSLSAQWPLFSQAWPSVMQGRMNDAGANVQVRNFSTGSHSFFRANTVATYGALTAVEAVIAYKPDVVIVELGGNDATGSALGTGDARTLTQIQADATTAYASLAAGLPNAVLIQVNLIAYDTANFTTANVVNKGIIPRFMTKKSSGILTNLDTAEYLDDNVSSANRGFLDDYEDLMTTIDAIAGVEVIEIDLFKIERLGVGLVDRTHYTQFGHALISADIIKQLRANAAFTALVPVIATQLTGALFEGEDVEALFDDYLAASGDGYVDNTPGVNNGEDTNSSWGDGRVIHTDNWFMSYKASCVLDVDGNVYNSLGPENALSVRIDRAAPLATLSYSIDGAAFVSTNTATDARGRLNFVIPTSLFNLSNAAHSFRFKVGTSVWLHSVTMNATVIGNVNTTAVGNVTTGEDDLITFTIPAGFAFPAAGRGIRVVQHGTFANTAAAKTARLYFGTAAILTGSLTTNLAGNWRGEWHCHSTGTDTQKYEGFFIVQTAAGTWISLNFQGTATQDDAATIVIKATGEATNTNDIIQTFQRVYYE